MVWIFRYKIQRSDFFPNPHNRHTTARYEVSVVRLKFYLRSVTVISDNLDRIIHYNLESYSQAGVPFMKRD